MVLPPLIGGRLYNRNWVSLVVCEPTPDVKRRKAGCVISHTGRKKDSANPDLSHEVSFSYSIMLIIYQIYSIHLITLINFISAAPLITDPTELLPREIFDSSPPLMTEDSESSDFFYSSSTQRACLSSQTELFISSTEPDWCPGGGTKLPDEVTPLPSVKLDLPDVLDVFGIGGEDEQNPDAVNKGTWEGEDLNPCQGRSPYRLHVCCEGELGIFDGGRLSSIGDCVLRTYRIMAPPPALKG